MALTYNARAAEIMRHLVDHDAHGYSQPHRAGNGTIETLTLSDGTVTTVHGGDYDCSEAVRMCYVAAGVLPRGCYMWTGNEASLLTSHHFVRVPLSGLQVGDVLLRSGHTEMVISVNGTLRQAGFRRSEHHTANGTVGDQDGYEGAYSALAPSAWSWAYRYEGAQPSGASATPVHDATVAMDAPAGTYRCVVPALNVRAGAGTGYSVVARYTQGDTVTLDGTAIVADGCVWGRYTGASGNLRYVAVRTTGGMTYLERTGVSASQPAQGDGYADCTWLQRIVGAVPDDIWGPDTGKRVGAVQMASMFHGVCFPYGVKYTQTVVGATPDGIWGNQSKACHDAKVREIQRGFGIPADGILGAVTDGCIHDLHERSRHTV